jgi:hypothetical protein
MKIIFPAGALAVGFLFAATARAQLTMPVEVTHAFDQVNHALTYESPDGKIYAHLGGEVDLTEYYLDGQPFGIIFSNPSSHFLTAPRLTLNFNAAYGDRLLFFAKFRWDNGIDPGYESNSARLDEIFLRVAVVPQHFDVQAGKFATVFGAWSGRHGAWENPFVTAPLPYDQVTSVVNGFAFPSASAFAALRNKPDNLNNWVSVIWGPAYQPGVAGFATWGNFDLALSGTTQALSAPPDDWNELYFGRPSFTGRLGWRPSPAWNLGISGSVGPYLESSAASFLPLGTSLGDFDQITVGGDAWWGWHNWEVLGEFIFSRFQVPNAGNADTFSWYLQAKYQITAQLFVAARWNQQVYNQVETATGPQNWDNDEMRLDLALGYAWDEHVLTKLQYSWQHQETSFQNGQQLVAAQLVVRF